MHRTFGRLDQLNLLRDYLSPRNGYLQACFQPVRATSVCEANSGNVGLVAQVSEVPNF